MSEELLRPVTLSDVAVHEAVACFATQQEATDAARALIQAGEGWSYYLTDKRGSWEVMRYRAAKDPLS